MFNDGSVVMGLREARSGAGRGWCVTLFCETSDEEGESRRSRMIVRRIIIGAGCTWEMLPCIEINLLY